MAVTIRGFADSEAAPASQHTLDVCDDPLSFIQELFLLQFVVERNQQNNAESVGP
ncbi:hypothetical protein [Candidatus Binatus sp.]|uniref:hypothetical protein n=1 Tax=Candidatus Binatus sp. TaxID=2811406 RepID=UPI002FDA9E33